MSDPQPIPELRQTTLADPGFRKAVLDGNADARATLDALNRIQAGQALPGDLERLPNAGPPRATTEALEDHAKSWGHQYDRNLSLARSAGSALKNAGLTEQDVNTLQRVMGHGPVLDAFLDASAAKEPGAIADALAKAILKNPAYVKAYRNGGRDSVAGRVLTRLQEISTGVKDE